MPTPALESETPLAAIERAFGWEEGFPHAMLYNANFALRFDLGGFATGPHRVLRAIDRARAVAKAAFSDTGALTVFASYYDAEKRTSRASGSFRALKEMGFPGRFSKPESVFQRDEDHIADFGIDLCRYWCRTDLHYDEALVDVILWASIVAELDVHPKARWLRFHIADLERKIVLHVYDDRGMDLCGPSKVALAPIYKTFNTWLLDYDRATMDKTFS